MSNKITKKRVGRKLTFRSRGGFSIMFFILGAFVVVFVVLGYLLISKPYRPNILSNGEIESYINSSTIQIPDSQTKIKLENGKGIPDSENSGFVTVTKPYFSVKTGNGYDVFTVMEYNLGGSGVFTAVALFQIEKEEATFKGSYPIGDRVPVEEITGPVQSASGEYELEVEYKDRLETENMSDMPTVIKTAVIKISNHEILQK